YSIITLLLYVCDVSNLQSYCERTRSIDSLPAEQKLTQPSFPYLPAQKCHYQSSDQSAAHLGISHFCSFSGDNKIARGHDSRAACNRCAVYCCNRDQSRLADRDQSVRHHRSEEHTSELQSLA